MAIAAASAYLLANTERREEKVMKGRESLYRVALISITIALVAGCDNPTGSGNNGGGGSGGGGGSAVEDGKGRVEITGAESLTLEGDASWAYVTDINSGGTTYAQFDVTVQGTSPGIALEIRVLQPYDPDTESRPDAPDDGTYQPGSSMDDDTVRFINDSTFYYFDSPSSGTFTLTQDATGDLWTIEVSVTGLDDYSDNLVNVDATIKAVPESD